MRETTAKSNKFVRLKCGDGAPMLRCADCDCFACRYSPSFDRNDLAQAMICGRQSARDYFEFQKIVGVRIEIAEPARLHYEHPSGTLPRECAQLREG
jgi:hypothetical protein